MIACVSGVERNLLSRTGGSITEELDTTRCEHTRAIQS